MQLYVWRVLFSQPGNHGEHQAFMMVISDSRSGALAAAEAAAKDESMNGHFIFRSPPEGISDRAYAVRTLSIDEDYKPRLVVNGLMVIGDNGDCC